ncbi:dienelactone hydrolase family protein [Pseudooceanicola sp. GBMRC 2024]|uniref:Dienelactone hydrolase family protein n=1 Tax=Pseudooceanicola albus TaxID=2692189 RepID=A0A6L7G2W6_9RHOB|nr:dienelactone hydrolase family protein [Pseudooceanicola albus]
MTRLTSADFHPKLLHLYDQYAHGMISKRAFLEKAGGFAVGGLSAAAIYEAMKPDYALAQQVSFTDPDIHPEYITYPSPRGHGEVRGYLVRPTGVSGALPAVVVVHENRGLNPYIEDVARRVAKAGFIALAPDGLTPLGGYPGNDDEGRAMQSQLDQGKLLEDFLAAVRYLQGSDMTTGKVGITGFCYGGGVANAAAVAFPDLGAAVPFYGRQPKAEDVARIEAPLLIHYGGLDERINAGWPAYKAALEAAGKTYEAHVYEGANHGFHNDSTPRYDPEQADLAWSRTLEWFGTYLA